MLLETKKEIEIDYKNNKWKLLLMINSDYIIVILKKMNSDIEYSNKLNKNEYKELIDYSLEENEISIEENEGLYQLSLKFKNNKVNSLIISLNNKDNLNLKNIKRIKVVDNGIITSLSKFPCGNIICVSDDKSIKIFDNNLNILIQHIENAHDDSIYYVNVKNENNFVTCSRDKSIRTWIKKENKFKLNKVIYNAHNDSIRKILYLNENIISCSMDNSLKIWEENNNKNIYQCTTILIHSSIIFSFLFLQDKNILITGGKDGIKFWNFNNYELINYIKKVECCSPDSLTRINKNNIIVSALKDNKLKIISLNQKKIIKEINNQFITLSIYSLIEKNIFLVGGRSNDIKIYRNDNYECIQIIKKAHNRFIKGFIESNNNSILSYSVDGNIKIWIFESK